MNLYQDNGLTYYRFGLLDSQPGLIHGIFTRHGGVSPEPCRGLNLAFATEDSAENVRANMTLASGALGLDDLAFAGQVHGDRSLEVGSDYRPQRREDIVVGYDALITRVRGLGLLMKLADCQGVLLYDPRTEILALIHSGWRGSVQNIVGKTAARLRDEFGVKPDDLLAGISPSLGPCCAEFVNYREELPEHFLDYRVGGNHFDFWAVTRDQLRAEGVRSERIETAGVCTKCSPDFYSYRREKVTGRFGIIAGLAGED